MKDLTARNQYSRPGFTGDLSLLDVSSKGGSTMVPKPQGLVVSPREFFIEMQQYEKHEPGE